MDLFLLRENVEIIHTHAQNDARMKPIEVGKCWKGKLKLVPDRNMIRQAII